MNFNFELILFYATVIAGLIMLFDVIFLAKKRATGAPYPIIIDYARSFFPVLLLVFLLRSFLYEGFRIPSGSLEPTLVPGDFIAVNKFDYGIRLPILGKKIIGSGEPHRGDIFVFHYPPTPTIYYIKRVIGLPGDHISYINRELRINGKLIPQKFVQNIYDEDESGMKWPTTENRENLLGVKHDIYIIPSKTSTNFKNIVVPPGMYFAMGDNRDDSADSRYWGFVPEENVVGKATLIILSWEPRASWLIPWHKIRWGRIWKKIQ